MLITLKPDITQTHMDVSHDVIAMNAYMETHDVLKTVYFSIVTIRCKVWYIIVKNKYAQTLNMKSMLMRAWN
jgi:hypothetical protein